MEILHPIQLSGKFAHSLMTAAYPQLTADLLRSLHALTTPTERENFIALLSLFLEHSLQEGINKEAVTPHPAGVPPRPPKLAKSSTERPRKSPPTGPFPAPREEPIMASSPIPDGGPLPLVTDIPSEFSLPALPDVSPPQTGEPLLHSQPLLELISSDLPDEPLPDPVSPHATDERTASLEIHSAVPSEPKIILARGPIQFFPKRKQEQEPLASRIPKIARRDMGGCGKCYKTVKEGTQYLDLVIKILCEKCMKTAEAA